MPFLPLDGTALAAELSENAQDILAYLPAVRRCAEREHEQTVCIEAVERAALRQLRCAQNLGAYALLHATPPPAEPVCVTTLAQALWQKAALLCPRAEWHWQAPPDSVWVQGSARLLAIVLGNLASNSLLFAAEAPALSLTLTAQNTTALLTLQDNGKGMLSTTASAAFEAWRSLDPYGDTCAAPGLGLGLAIAHRYTAVYGGRTALESRFGSGCRVTLALPLCSTMSASAKSACSDSFPQSTTNIPTHFPAPDYAYLIDGACGIARAQLGAVD